MSLPFKKDRFILMAVALLLAAAYGVYYMLRHPERMSLSIEADRIVLTVLTIIMGLLVVGLVFLLLRNLIKLYVERRRQVLGSRFRTKLVFTFLVLVLLPSVLLFYAAATLIQQVNESLFSEPLEQIMDDSKSTVDAYNRLLRADCERFAEMLAGEIAGQSLLAPERERQLETRAESYIADNGLDVVAIYALTAEGLDRVVFKIRQARSSRAAAPDDELSPAGSKRIEPNDAESNERDAELEREESPPEPARSEPLDSAGKTPTGSASGAAPGSAGNAVPESVRGATPEDGTAELPDRRGSDGQPSRTARRVRFEDMAIQALTSAASSNRLDRILTWQRASAVSPIRTGSPFKPVAGAVVVARYITPDLAERTDKIDRGVGDYKKRLKRQPAFKRIYILLFSILTLLVLFAAAWTGFYLTRQITVPIEALAAGTKAITSGNLDYRVTAQAGDEIGFLIDSFNQMTDELRSNREAIDTSRRQLQASYVQLEERRRYIEQLLENVPAAVVSVDLRGNITTMNREAHRILRIDPARPVLGLLASEVLSREEFQPLLHEIEDVSHGEALSLIREFEFSVEGRPMHLAVNVSARRDAEGKFQGVLIVMEDLTPLIRAQRTAAWREVARRMAHEIKNPLTPIQLSAQRILKKFHEGNEEFPRIVEEGVSTIVKEVATLQTLVDEFSRFARMPAVSPVPTDPNALVDRVVSLYDGIQPGIEIKTDLQRPLPAAPLDPEQMKRVLVNLIDNAIAAMEGRGRITLRTRALPEQTLFRLEIEDDGPGIAPENKERLFLPYFSTKKRGTGLGLAIVNRIVADHNGFIRVEDNIPKGTRFVIDLPA